jgi:type III pantothenate kinase
MVRQAFRQETLTIDAANAGLPIRYHAPEDVGADRLVNGLAALTLYGGAGRPVISVDFGTATTFDVISGAGEYVGGVICPGVEISADALFLRAARLPRVDVRRPDHLIGTSTVASMQSGLFFGYVAMVEGIVARLRDELGGDEPAVCVATGGLAGIIAGETSAIDHVSPDLTLHGLRLAWRQNTEVSHD